MATHSNTLAWEIQWMEEPGGLQSMGLWRVRHDWVTSLFTFMHWRKKWQPTPVFLPGESQGWGSLVGYHLWGCTESDTTEWLSFHFHALEKEMATHSSILAWRIPGTGAWWAAIYGVTHSRTRLMWLSSSSIPKYGLSSCLCGWSSLILYPIPSQYSISQTWIFTGRTWCWSWNSNTLATWCEELIHLKRPWRWEWLKAGGDDSWWDGWMASPTQWT